MDEGVYSSMGCECLEEYEGLKSIYTTTKSPPMVQDTFLKTAVKVLSWDDIMIHHPF